MSSRRSSSSAAPVPAEVEAVKASFRDRIVGFRRVKAGELRANKSNWRLHPDSQRNALRGMLEEVGIVGAVIAREVDGGLELVDGHLRADIAKDQEVPVLVVDLNEGEAAKVLATYDPMGDMAMVDEQALSALLQNVDLDDNADLRRLLADLSTRLVEEEDAEEEKPEEVPGMGLRPHEHYDYILVLASTTQEFNVLCEKLDMKPAARRGRMGTCRAVRANKLLGLLK